MAVRGTWWLVLVGLALVVGCTPDTPPVVPPEPHLPATPSTPLDPHLIAFTACTTPTPPGFRCATLDVPLDRSDPSKGKIPLRVMGLPHTDLSTPEREPLFATPGGPGMAGSENYALWILPGLVDAHRDVIAIDGRGSGQSGTIDCADMQDGWASHTELMAAIRACASQLGPTADRFSASDRALDVEAVRAWLGYDRILFHGQSFAAQDVQAYAARFGNRLRAVVLDSGAAADDMPFNQFGVGVPQGLLGAAATLCAQDACGRYGNPTTVLATLVHQVGRRPVSGRLRGSSEPIVVDQAAVAAIIDGSVGTDTLAMRSLFAAARALAAGDRTPLLELARESPRWQREGDGDPTVMSTGANIAGNCVGQPLSFGQQDPPVAKRAKLEAAIAALPAKAFAPWEKHAWTSYWLADNCTEWPPARDAEAVMPPGASFPGIPALILQGELDPAGPASAELLRVFPDGLRTVVRGARHATLSRGRCIATYEAVFLDTLKPPTADPCP